MKWLNGRIAEVIVERLFTDLGYDLQRFGIEHSNPRFADTAYKKKGPVSKMLRQTPDFVAQRNVPGNSGMWFLEVKYRSNGTCSITDLDKHGPYSYPKALIILVTPEGIRAQSYENLKSGGDFIALCSMKFLHTDDTVVSFYDAECRRIFRRS